MTMAGLLAALAGLQALAIFFLYRLADRRLRQKTVAEQKIKSMETVIDRNEKTIHSLSDRIRDLDGGAGGVHVDPDGHFTGD